MKAVILTFAFCLAFGENVWIFSQLGKMSCWATSDSQEHEWFQDLIPKKYYSVLPPGNFFHGPQNISEKTRVDFELDVHSVTELCMKSMDFDVDLDISIKWYDHRLHLHPDAKLNDRGSILPQEVSSKLWCPIFRFQNVNEGENKLITPESSGPASIIHISNAKKNYPPELHVDYRKTFSFSCVYHFHAYPFDVQRCQIFLKLAYQLKNPIASKLNLQQWRDIRVPPGFSLQSVEVSPHRHKSNSQWHYVYKSLEFRFQRVYAQHLMHIFFPSELIVMLSWVSFWLDAEVAAPRVALGLTTILTLSTMFNAAQKDLPPVAEIKALDVWMFSCILMVVASLVEFAIANYFHKKKMKEEPKRATLTPVYACSNVYPGQENKLHKPWVRNGLESQCFHSKI